MTVLLVPIIVVLVIAIVVAVGMWRWTAAHRREADALAAPASSTLDYRVPAGQDPAVVLSALVSEGYDATTDPQDTMLVHVSCPPGPDRERARVRATIEAAGQTAIDTGVPFEPAEVRFVDER
jgi:hypothetical protein